LASLASIQKKKGAGGKKKIGESGGSRERKGGRGSEISNKNKRPPNLTRQNALPRTAEKIKNQ